MEPTPEIAVPQNNRRTFYFITIILLLGAIVTSSIQKGHDSTAVIARARLAQRQNDIHENRESPPEVAAAADVDMRQLLQNAKVWGMVWGIVSIAVFALAIVSWAVAIWRREPGRWVRVPVVVLFVFWFLLLLLMT